MNQKVEQSYNLNFNEQGPENNLNQSPLCDGIVNWINQVESAKNVSHFSFLCSDFKPLNERKVPQKKKIKKRSLKNKDEQEWTFKDYKILKGYLIIFPNDQKFICKLMSKFSPEEIHKRIEFLQLGQNNKITQQKTDFCGFAQKSNTKPLQNKNIFKNSLQILKDENSINTTLTSPVPCKNELPNEGTLKLWEVEQRSIPITQNLEKIQKNQGSDQHQEKEFNNFTQQNKQINETLKMAKKMRRNNIRLENEFQQFNKGEGISTHQRCSFFAIEEQYNAFKSQIFQSCQNQNITSSLQDFSSFC